MTLVRVILRKNEAALIQYKEEDRYWRSWVPLSIIEETGDRFYVSNPQQGIPFGEDFAAFLISIGMTEALAIEIDSQLKGRGVWTWTDLYARPDLVVGAYSSALRVSAEPLFKEATRQIKLLGD